MLNQVVIVGRLVGDVELKETEHGKKKADITLAVPRSFKNFQGERETDFINIVVWRKQAENVKNYLSKGSKVAIDGHIQTRSYDDQNGIRKHITEVVAENVEFLDSRKSGLVENSPVNDKRSDEPFKEFAQEHNLDGELPF